MSGSETSASRCRKCGRELETQHPVCPRCALEEALSGAGDEPGADFLSLHDIPPPGQKVSYIGDYELIDVIARGGMGVVYRARQRSPNRIVALKMLLGGIHASDEFKRRFRQEAEAVAILDHPNIVPIYEVGEHEGCQYFSMKLVEGGSLSQRITDRQRKVDKSNSRQEQQTICRLMACVARAVYYAHQRGVLHRDLKPGNILLDAQGQPHVTDFGLAKLTEHDVELTHSGAIMGTPSYMSPEQAAGRFRDLTTATDIYSLGALFYELLTGHPPFFGATAAVTLQKVLTEEPRRPTTLSRHISRDLETICLKCLEKDPARRYRSGDELARDLEAWCDGRPIDARPSGPIEQIWKWTRRKPALAAFAAALTLSLLAGFAGVTWQWLRAEQSKSNAIKTLSDLQTWKAERLIADGNVPKAVNQLAGAIRENPENRIAVSRLLSLLSDRNFAFPLGPTLPQDATVSGIEFSPDGKLILILNTNGPVRIYEASEGCRLIATLSHSTPQIHSAMFSPDGKSIVTAGSDRTARIWNSRTGQPQTPPLTHADQVMFASFSPDGTKIVTASSDRTAKIWEARTGVLLGAPFEHKDKVTSAQFSPDGRNILTASDDGLAYVWDIQPTSTPLRTVPHVDPDIPPRFSPDGVRFLTLESSGPNEHAVAIRETATGQLLSDAIRQKAPIWWVDFSPDGQKIVTGSADGSAGLWDVVTGTPLVKPMNHSTPNLGLLGAQLSPDEQLVATTALNNRTTLVWDAITGARVREPIVQGGDGTCVLFSPDGQKLATGSFDKTARLWDIRFRAALNEPLKHLASINSVTFSPDGKRLLTVSEDMTARLWNGASRQLIGSPLIHDSPVLAGKFLPGAEQILTLSRDGRLRVWDPDKATVVSQSTVHTGTIQFAQFGLDGQSLLIACDTGLIVWDIQTSRPSGPAITFSRPPHLANLSPDGQKNVSVATQGSSQASVWNVRTGRLLTDRLIHDGPITAVEFSADNARVVTASLDFSTKVWDIATSRTISVFRHLDAVAFARFSPDATKIISGSRDQTASIWDAHTGLELVEPLKHSGGVRWAAFSPDGKYVATATKNAMVRVWDVATGLPLTEWLRQPAAMLKVEFSPDGRRIAATTADHGAWLLELPIPDAHAPSWLPDLAELVAIGIRDETGLDSEKQWTKYTRIRTEALNIPSTDFYGRWATWFFAQPTARSISPWSDMPTADYLQRRIEEGTLNSLRESIRIDPTNGLALARLAERIFHQDAMENSRKAGEADFLSRRALQFSPDDPEVRRIRSEIRPRL